MKTNSPRMFYPPDLLRLLPWGEMFQGALKHSDRRAWSKAQGMEQEIRARLLDKRYREAFELLVPEFQDKVFRLACAMLSNEALAEETAQDVFIRVWKALPGFRGESSLSTWIYAVTRNTCLSARRKESARGKLVSIDEPGVEREAEHRQTPGREASAVDWLALLAELPEKQRQVVVLFYLEERSYEEVARMLDLPMGTVKTYLFRARKQLAVALLKARTAQGAR